MPCTAKKFEKTRPYQDAAGKGIQDVDYALTSRELARFIKRQGIMFNELKDEEFDAPMGIASGAGLIFGATGGVMEAALRTVYEVLEKKELKNLDFEAVRGTEGIKEAVIPVHVNGKLVDVKVAAVSGLANAKIIMEKIKNGEADYHFIEVMACPGGCVNGGGQPIQPADVRNNVDIRKIRAAMLYETDKSMALRKSHESPVVKELYDTYFGEPGSEKSHHILHTKYVARGK
jgi:NADP-reducing hydrogenase subunit HndD